MCGLDKIIHYGTANLNEKKETLQDDKKICVVLGTYFFMLCRSMFFSVPTLLDTIIFTDNQHALSSMCVLVRRRGRFSLFTSQSDKKIGYNKVGFGL